MQPKRTYLIDIIKNVENRWGTSVLLLLQAALAPLKGAPPHGLNQVKCKKIELVCL